MLTTNNFSIEIEKAKQNKHELSNIVRILLLKSSPALMERYQNKGDDFFLNPLIFACLNNRALTKTEGLLSSILNKQYDYGALDQDGFLYLKEVPDFIKGYFFEMYKGEMINEKPDFDLELNKLAEARKALAILAQHLPDFNAEFKESNQLILFHNNPRILNFVTKSFHGFLSFWIVDEVSEIYFIEEFIHQGSHNFLNLIFHKKEVFFTEDPEEVSMTQITGNTKDYRSFISAIHGLYTIIKRVESFRVLLEKGIYEDELKHELLGRYTDQLIRFKNLGIYHDNVRHFLTSEGLAFFNQMVDFGNEMLEKDKYLLDLFNLEWRDIDFYYSQFAAANDFTHFKKHIAPEINFD